VQCLDLLEKVVLTGHGPLRFKSRSSQMGLAERSWSAISRGTASSQSIPRPFRRSCAPEPSSRVERWPRRFPMPLLEWWRRALRTPSCSPWPCGSSLARATLRARRAALAKWAEGSHFLLNLSALQTNQQVGHDRGLMHIESTSSLNQGFGDASAPRRLLRRRSVTHTAMRPAHLLSATNGGAFAGAGQSLMRDLCPLRVIPTSKQSPNTGCLYHRWTRVLEAARSTLFPCWVVPRRRIRSFTERIGTSPSSDAPVDRWSGIFYPAFCIPVLSGEFDPRTTSE
jgi:hypothetical protein